MSKKEYKTSDNCSYLVNEGAAIDWLILHCEKNNLQLFDVQEKKEIEIKSKKKLKDEPTEG